MDRQGEYFFLLSFVFFIFFQRFSNTFKYFQKFYGILAVPFFGADSYIHNFFWENEQRGESFFGVLYAVLDLGEG